MKTRKINFTVEIEDNDVIQFNLEKLLYKIIGKEKIKDLRVLPNTDHLKNNKTYITLSKAERKAKELKYNFINQNRE